MSNILTFNGAFICILAAFFLKREKNINFHFFKASIRETQTGKVSQDPHKHEGNFSNLLLTTMPYWSKEKI